MSDLLTISYRSLARLREPTSQLQAILKESRRRNAELGITGILLFDGTYFMQTIEGPLDNSATLFARIVEDGRHDEVVPFGVAKIATRAFPDWTMELIGPEVTADIVPDMEEFDFTDRRLRLVHKAVMNIAA
ncbi:BLUF domain-containing protein [Seohaeicola zhoushanensis]|uniref:Blue-light sensor BLUF n=1 Tax=Seohaeicola zhoushanensis TaxID=1569283 RepID=A0A8J3H1J8_9RHOB|nr:BLUF domain-containing protein [Seohaeicola zhoushanensis]GHF73138.1 blue-light sensor BLUF [Seohaeicola zhoushanensis]